MRKKVRLTNRWALVELVCLIALGSVLTGCDRFASASDLKHKLDIAQQALAVQKKANGELRGVVQNLTQKNESLKKRVGVLEGQFGKMNKDVQFASQIEKQGETLRNMLSVSDPDAK